jgi:hypothetical protein
MSGPRRILDGGLGRFERQVVGSAIDDAPSAEFRRRMAMKASLLATVSAASGAASGAAQTAGTLAWVKMFGIGAIAGLATGGLYRGVSDLVGSAESGRLAPVQAVSAPTTRNSERSVTTAVIGAPVPAVSVPTPAPGAPPSEARPSRATPTESPVPVDSAATERESADSALAEELRAIERVRRALSVGDASGALRELERYESASHAGRFRIEADVLRIEALTRRGEVDQARALAETFLSTHQGSPYVRRVTAIIGGSR